VISATGAIIVAIAGVLGTLLSPLVTTWLTLKSKRQDYEFDRRDKLEERSRDDMHAAFTERRDCYIALNMSAREYHAAIRTKTHRMENSRLSKEIDKSLVETRREYRRRYGEAQMIVPDDILQLASRINGILADAYGMMRSIEEESLEEGATPDAVRRILETAWEPLRQMRAAMRNDLGIRLLSSHDQSSLEPSQTL
jgi:hypothetical protein